MSVPWLGIYGDIPFQVWISMNIALVSQVSPERWFSLDYPSLSSLICTFHKTSNIWWVWWWWRIQLLIIYIYPIHPSHISYIFSSRTVTPSCFRSQESDHAIAGRLPGSGPRSFWPRALQARDLNGCHGMPMGPWPWHQCGGSVGRRGKKIPEYKQELVGIV